MTARTDLEDEKVKTEYEKAYKIVISFIQQARIEIWMRWREVL
jgi:hypothetical protein